jgi:hypothetical protein
MNVLYTSTYVYIRIHSVFYAFQKVQKGLEPAIFCILFAELTPAQRPINQFIGVLCQVLQILTPLINLAFFIINDFDLALEILEQSAE